MTTPIAEAPFAPARNRRPARRLAWLHPATSASDGSSENGRSSGKPGPNASALGAAGAPAPDLALHGYRALTDPRSAFPAKQVGDNAYDFRRIELDARAFIQGTGSECSA